MPAFMKLSKRINRSWYGDSMITLMLLAIGLFSSFPLIYTVVQAFKPMDEIFIWPPRFYVVHPTLENFTTLSTLVSNMWVPFSRYVFNSLFVSIIVTVGHVIFASMAAYPLAKHKFLGRKTMFQIVMLALLFNQGMMAIPQYIVMAKLGLVDTYYALILPAIASALGLFLMKQFMEQIPDAIIESARIDGAHEFKVFWSIIMPAVKPAWLTLCIFAFQAIWNYNGGGFIYSEQLKLLPLALGQINSGGGIARMGSASAAAMIVLIPPILTFIFTQSRIIQTMSHSGMKD